MCGLAGIISLSNEGPWNRIQDVQTMIDQIIARGPDDEGIQDLNRATFGFRRLSIIDLENGHQPMVDAEGKVMLVFNGEIYNFIELRNSLISEGVEFKTHSDTEVILNLYLKHGKGFQSYLRGMFAIAIYDSRIEEVFLIRDRFGIKPLYYALIDDQVLFGSELKSIVSVAKKSLTIDPIALDQFFSYGYILDDYSIFKEVRKVKAAECIHIQCGDSKNIDRALYWSPSFHPNHQLSWKDSLSIVESALADTVDQHLVSDVPVGAFLSGGMDSNMILASMAKKYGNPIHTFTIGFQDQQYDESGYARLAARKWNTQHHELIIGPDDLVDLEQIILHFDEPFADSSAIPTYYVSQLAASEVKVVLSGDGGDEIFAGYDTYRRALKMKQWSTFTDPVRFGFKWMAKAMSPRARGRRFLYNLSYPTALQYAFQVQINALEKRAFYTEEWMAKLDGHSGTDKKVDILKNSTSSTFLGKMQELDLTTFMKDDVLVKVDRMSMLHSLEVRVPLIDHTFFEQVSVIPDHFKIKDEKGKFIFRELGKDDLPSEIYNKPKSGFTIPIFKWYKGDFRNYLFDHLSKLKGSGIIRDEYLEEIMSKPDDFGSLSTRLWPLLVFSVWYQNFKKE